MQTQNVGQSLYLVIRTDEGFEIEHRVVWGAKDTETNWGERGYLVLVEPGNEYDSNPPDAMLFRHGQEPGAFAGAFEDYEIARGVRDHLNGN